MKSKISLAGAALKCWSCNSKYDPRCGEPFNNFSMAMVDCDQQKGVDVPHLTDNVLTFYNRDIEETDGASESPKETEDLTSISLCRKTTQSGNVK